MDLPSRPTALSLSPDKSHAAIAGKNMLRTVRLPPLPSDVQQVDPWKHTTLHNLRPRTSKNDLSSAFNDVSWHPIHEHLLATGSSAGTVLVWDLLRPTSSNHAHTLAHHHHTVHAVAWHPNESSMLMTVAQDKRVLLWDLRDDSAVPVQGFSLPSPPRDAQWSSSGWAFAVACDDGQALVRDWRNAEQSIALARSRTPLLSLAWSTHGSLAVSSADGLVRVCADVYDGTTTTTTFQTPGTPSEIAWNPTPGSTSQLLVPGICGRLELWETGDSAHLPIRSVPVHSQPVSGCVWRDGSTVLSVGADKRLEQTSLDMASNPRDELPRIAAVWDQDNVLWSTHECRNPASAGNRSILGTCVAESSSLLKTLANSYHITPRPSESDTQYISRVCTCNARIAAQHSLDFAQSAWNALSVRPPASVVHALIQTLLELGDVQHAACMAVVSARFTVIDPHTLRSVLAAHIEQLRQAQLYTHACEFVRLSAHESLQAFYTKPSSVQTPSSLLCALCRTPVLSRVLWCAGCGHGGHYAGLSHWYRSEQTCPQLGCMHQCTPSLGWREG